MLLTFDRKKLDGSEISASTDDFLSETDVCVTCTSLSKSYGGLRALDDVSLSIKRGEIVALVGPNGAGKSTLVEILAGLRQPDTGEICILGDNPAKGERGYLQRLGLQLQETKFFVSLSGRDYFKLFAKLYNRSINTAELIGLLDLERFIDQPIRQLSGGQRQRIALALAIINDPEMIILDEPTVGLDPVAREEFWCLIRKLHDGGRRTLIFTTHYMDEVAALASRVVFMAQGTVRMNGPVEHMILFAGENVGSLDEAYRRLAVKPGAQS